MEITQEHIDSGKNRYRHNGKLYKAVTVHNTKIIGNRALRHCLFLCSLIWCTPVRWMTLFRQR